MKNDDCFFYTGTAELNFKIFTHLKLCVATATHNFKWVKIIHICLIWDLTFANIDVLKVIYHPLYSMNKFVTNKSELSQDGAQVFPYMGWLAIMWPSERVTW